MATILDLNKKWWYRLVKVLYVFTFIIVAALGAFIVFSSDQNKVDYDKTVVMCTNGFSTSTSQVGQSITQFSLGFPFAATGVVFRGEKPTDTQLEFLHIGFFPYSESNEFDVAYTTLCSADFVAMKDGTSKLVQSDKIDSVDLVSALTVNGKPINYDNGTARPSLPTFVTWDNTSNGRNYDIKIVSENHTQALLIYVLTWLVICAAFFEGVRRVFYYVVTGQIRPK